MILSKKFSKWKRKIKVIIMKAWNVSISCTWFSCEYSQISWNSLVHEQRWLQAPEEASKRKINSFKKWEFWCLLSCRTELSAPWTQLPPYCAFLNWIIFITIQLFTGSSQILRWIKGAKICSSEKLWLYLMILC